jgi:hypothetical protein
MMTLKGTLTLGFSVAILAFALPAFSKGPDWKTPAEEDTCDSLRGATPGLYGLCVAYCEAHDADLISPSGDPNELNTPNQRILANYNRRKKESDPPMPCVAAEPEPLPVPEAPPEPEGPPELCPCWTSAELKEMLPPSANYDHNLPRACGQTSSSIALENYEFGSTGPSYELKVWAFEGCYVRKDDYLGGPPAGTSWATREEEDSCRTLLMNHARENSIPGVVWDCFNQ